MRSSSLILAVAVPAISALQSHSAAQAPVLVRGDAVATNTYHQGAALNASIGTDLKPFSVLYARSTANVTCRAAIAKSSPAEEAVDPSEPPSAGATSRDIPAPSLDKSIFSLIVFGIAGLCLV
jgi:hypothetical protein